MDKIIDGKKITAAIVMIDSKGDILGCHATGKSVGTGYDFPKGCVEVGESDIHAAIRELREETDIYLLDYDIAKIKDAGIHKHNKEKNIHLFIYPTTYFPDINQLKCNSFFISPKTGRQVPEINGYKIISKEERSIFNKILQDKFEIIDKFNK